LQTKMIRGTDFSYVWVIDVKCYMDLSDSIFHNLFNPASRKISM